MLTLELEHHDSQKANGVGDVKECVQSFQCTLSLKIKTDHIFCLFYAQSTA